MNARIKDLVEQATRPRGPTKPAEFDKEYFAELIVLKCAELMYGRDEDGNCKDGDLIKKHFGIEV